MNTMETKLFDPKVVQGEPCKKLVVAKASLQTYAHYPQCIVLGFLEFLQNSADQWFNIVCKSNLREF